MLTSAKWDSKAWPGQLWHLTPPKFSPYCSTFTPAKRQQVEWNRLLYNHDLRPRLRLLVRSWRLLRRCTGHGP